MLRSLSFIFFVYLTASIPRPVTAADAPNPDPAAVAAAVQDGEIKRWLPNTHAKLSRRTGPVRVVILGDRVARFVQPNPKEISDPELAWHWLLLERLASRYYFTGGVRSIEAAKGKLKPISAASNFERRDDEEEGPRQADPLNFDTAGAAIIVDNQARKSTTAAESLTALTTDALDSSPDLVILNYGLSDIIQGTSPLAHGKALAEAIKYCQSKNLDVMVAGPTLLLGTQERNALGLSRAHASVAQEVAAAAKVCFFDLGAAQVEMAVDATVPRSTQGYDFVVRELRQQYDHKGEIDWTTPNADAHRILAEAAWKQLSAPAMADPISIQARLILPTEAKGRAQLELEFHSAGGSKNGLQEIAIGALGLDRKWVPVAEPATDGDTGKHSAIASSNVAEGWKLSIPCAAEFPRGPYPMSRPDLPWGEEPFARGSVLVSEGDHARLVNYRAQILPLNVIFPRGRLEGLSEGIPLAVKIINGSDTAFQGQAEVVWRGQTETFPITVKPGPEVPVTLKLPLPANAVAFKSLLTLRLKGAGGQYEFSRELEVSPTLKLDQRVALLNRSTAMADTPLPTGDQLGVNLTCKADDSGLYFIFDLPTIDLNRKGKQPSARIEVTIDARDATQRGQVGYCDALVLEVPWVDGKFFPDKIPFGMFGPGYDRTVDPHFFFASVTTQRDNRRQVRLSIPRAYFYLHGWDLKGTKQSTLGLNTQVELIHFADDNAPGTFILEKTFSLVSPGLPRNEAQALGVLNLAPQSLTWSARIY